MAQADNHWPLTKQDNPWKIHVGCGANNEKVGPVMHLYSLHVLLNWLMLHKYD